MRRILAALVLAATASCAAPGVEVVPLPGDFAFLQITLLG